MQKNLKNIGITIFQLVDIGILIGTDYFPGIKNIGPKKALDLIRKYKTIEQVPLNEHNNYDFDELTLDILKKVRKIFLFPDVKEQINNLIWNSLNKSGVLSLLCKEHNLDKERVITNIAKFEKNYKACRDYFLSKKDFVKTKQVTLDALL